MSIDLDAARAQRREAAGTKPSVTFGGRDFVLPVELPFEMADWGYKMATAETSEERSKALTGVLRLLLGDQYDAFMAFQPSMQDIDVLINGDEELGIHSIAEEYGLTVGESRASRRSSNSTRARPKPISKRATA